MSLIEEPLPDQEHRGKRLAMAGIKLLVAGLLLALVFSRVDFRVILTHLDTVPIPYIILSFVALNAAQIINAFRERYYFSTRKFMFTTPFAVALYYTGGLFNILLPGGISGDGYKAYLLKRHRRIPLLTSVRFMLSERASGVLFLLVFTFIFAYMGTARNLIPYGNVLLAAAAVALVPAYVFGVRFLLREPVRVAMGAARFSLFSQAAVSLSAAILFAGMGVSDGFTDYLALFMISCVVTILPVSIGSAGVREFTFLYGAPLLGLNVEIGVAAALAFFAISVAMSLIGLLFVSNVGKMAHTSIVYSGEEHTM